MLGSFQTKNTILILKNPHFWTIIIITLVLTLVYSQWPWRVWQFEDGVWQWFPWLSQLYNLALLEYKLHIVGGLFLIPILYATIVFGWRGACIFSVISLLGVLPVIEDLWVTTSSLITNMSVLLLPVTVVLLIRIEIELRRKDRTAFIQERQKYISIMLEAQEKERQRIAQELHDETVQTLVAIAKRAESIMSSEDNSDVSWIKNTTIQMIDDLRRITLDLRPSILDDMGLASALRWLVARTNSECDTNIRILVDGFERKLSAQVEITVFRVVQEALTNIKCHSKAREAVVALELDTESLKIMIRDDGQGIYPLGKLSGLASKGKLGLIGIRERVESLGGTCQIHSRPGKGTELIVEVNC
jgi:signal transduction histidine kinase